MGHDDGAHRPGRHDKRLLVAVMAPGKHRAQRNSSLVRQVHNIVNTETAESKLRILTGLNRTRTRPPPDHHGDDEKRKEKLEFPSAVVVEKEKGKCVCKCYETASPHGQSGVRQHVERKRGPNHLLHVATNDCDLHHDPEHGVWQGVELVVADLRQVLPRHDTQSGGESLHHEAKN